MTVRSPGHRPTAALAIVLAVASLMAPALLPGPPAVGIRSESLAQGWSNVTLPASPVPMAGAMMAYSSRANRFVLFGGWDGVHGLNGTWEFDPVNRTWTELQPSVAPIPRGDEMFVYDSLDDEFVLFGGWYEFPNGSYVRLADTWTFSLGTSTWTERHPATSPPARSDAEVAYDPRTDAVLLVGGFSGTSYLGDIWTLFPENDTWWPRPAGTQPSARADGRMAYVAAQDRFVLFGGNDYSGPNFTFHHLADTWSYRWGTNMWSLLPTTIAPSARDYPILAYDPTAQAVLLTSGYGNRTELNDLWELNLSTDTWGNITTTPAPPPRFAGAGGFDAADNVFVVFSGAGNNGLLGDTWEWGAAGSTPPAPALPLVTLGIVGATLAAFVVGGVWILRKRAR